MKKNITHIKNKLEAIELELKQLGRWSSEKLREEQYENMGAFGSHTMTYEQWIQFILIPNVQEIIQTKGEFPAGSETGVYAVRYFDGDSDASLLITLLTEFDDFFTD